MAQRAALVAVAPVNDYDMDTVAVAAKAGAGGVLFLGTASPPSDLGSQLATALGNSPTRPLAMADEEGGEIQRLVPLVPSLPWPRDMAKTMSADEVQQQAQELGAAMLDAGVGMDLAPVLDIDGGVGPNATNPDGSRSFSPDPATASQYGLAFADGLEAGGVVPVVKHFPGLGGSSGNTDDGPAKTLPYATLQQGGLIPFQNAIKAGVPAVMVANATVPGLTDEPASLSSSVINDLLREEYGFEGLVMTDSLSAGAISDAGYDVPAATVAAIAAGADQVLYGSTATPALAAQLSPENVQASLGAIQQVVVAATENGDLPIDRLNDAVDNILTARKINLC